MDVFNMYTFLSLLTIAADSFFYALVLTIATMVIVFFILQALSKSCVRTIPFYISGVFLFFLLLTQNTLMVAAFQCKGTMEAASIYIQQLVGYSTAPLDMHDTQGILNQLGGNFPLIGLFANITNMQVQNAQYLADAMTDSINSHLNTYIIKRIGWILLFLFTAIIVAMLADKGGNPPQRHTTTRRGARNNTGSLRASRRHRYQ